MSLPLYRRCPPGGRRRPRPPAPRRSRSPGSRAPEANLRARRRSPSRPSLPPVILSRPPSGAVLRRDTVPTGMPAVALDDAPAPAPRRADTERQMPAVVAPRTFTPTTPTAPIVEEPEEISADEVVEAGEAPGPRPSSVRAEPVVRPARPRLLPARGDPLRASHPADELPRSGGPGAHPDDRVRAQGPDARARPERRATNGVSRPSSDRLLPSTGSRFRFPRRPG